MAEQVSYDITRRTFVKTLATLPFALGVKMPAECYRWVTTPDYGESDLSGYSGPVRIRCYTDSGIDLTWDIPQAKVVGGTLVASAQPDKKRPDAQTAVVTADIGQLLRASIALWDGLEPLVGVPFLCLPDAEGVFQIRALVDRITVERTFLQGDFSIGTLTVCTS